MTLMRVALLGDSILDNAPYTEGEPDTTAHLRRLLGPQWEVTRAALDGAVMRDMRQQLAELGPVDVAVLSIGGNDALEHVGELTRPVRGSEEAIATLLRIADDFERRYADVARRVAAQVPRLILCTIYEVRLQPPELARLARVPIALLSDRIMSTARALGAEVLDLRAVCTEDDDFTMQIEPSAKGARRIAEAIAAALTQAPPTTIAPR